MSSSRRLNLKSKDLVETFVRVLREGGIVLHPTDTVYGLACDAFNPEALERMDLAKGGRKGKSFLVLAQGLEMVEQLAESLPSVLRERWDFFSSRPVTFIVKAKEPWPYITKEGKIAVRVPALAYLKEVIAALGSPLASTSANPTGKALTSFEEILSYFSGKVDLVVEGPTGGGKPSTIVDLTVRPPEIIREGAVSRDEVEEALAGWKNLPSSS